MAQEIELKFIVNHSAVEALRDHLNTLGGEHHDPVQLLNIYYETPDNWLRGHDMGLRIRGENGRYEMTMKVAGRVTGTRERRLGSVLSCFNGIQAVRPELSFTWA